VLKNTAVKFGLFTGLACIIWYLVAFFSGLHNSPSGIYVDFVPFIILIFGISFSIKQTRDKDNGGIIDYKNGVKAGMATSLITAVSLGIFIFFYYEFINPGFIDYFVGMAEKVWREQKYSDDDINKSIENIRMAFEPTTQMYKTFMAITFVGLLSSLILSLFMRRDRSFQS